MESINNQEESVTVGNPIIIQIIGVLSILVGLIGILLFIFGIADPSALQIVCIILAGCGIGILLRKNLARLIFKWLCIIFSACLIMALFSGYTNDAWIGIMIAAVFIVMTIYLEKSTTSKNYFNQKK